MVQRVTKDGKNYYLHTAWADDSLGTNFSVSRNEDALLCGTLLNTSSAEETDPSKYVWENIPEEDEDEFFDRLLDAEVEANASRINAENNADAIKGISQPNLLYETNNGKERWTASQQLSMNEYLYGGRISNLVNDKIYVSFEAISKTSNYAAFSIPEFLNEIDGEEDGTYTLSFNIKLSQNIQIPVSIRNTAGTADAIIALDTFSVDDFYDGFIHYESTFAVNSISTNNEMLYFDFSALPSGASCSIIDLKIERGAEATEWNRPEGDSYSRKFFELLSFGSAKAVYINQNNLEPTMYQDMEPLRVMHRDDDPLATEFSHPHASVGIDNITLYGAYENKFVGDPYLVITNECIECLQNVYSSSAASGYRTNVLWKYPPDEAAQEAEYTTFTCTALNSSYVSITSQHCRYYPKQKICKARLEIAINRSSDWTAGSLYSVVNIPSAYKPTAMFPVNVSNALETAVMTAGIIYPSSNSTYPGYIRLKRDSVLTKGTPVTYHIYAEWMLA